MSDIITTPNQTSWQRPEKTVGYVILGGITITVLYFWAVIVPFLVDMVFDTVKLGIGLGVLFLIFLAVTKGQTFFWYVGQRIFRTIASAFVNTDPIGIMKDYIKDTENEADKMLKDIADIQGGNELIKRKLAENNAKVKERLDLATAAQRTGDADASENYSSQAAQLDDYNNRLKPMADTSANVLIVLNQIYKAATRQIENAKFKVNILSDEYDLIKRTSSAMKSAMNILSGNKDKKYFFDLATDAAANQMANSLGQIKQAMKFSQGYVKEMDIQNGVMSDKGKLLLDKYQKGDFSQLLEAGQNTTPLLTNAAAQAKQGNDAYSALLD